MKHLVIVLLIVGLLLGLAGTATASGNREWANGIRLGRMGVLYLEAANSGADCHSGTSHTDHTLVVYIICER